MTVTVLATLGGQPLGADHPLVRAVVISLFTWRRAGEHDPIDDAERHGWWGDAWPTVQDDHIGSRLWLLRRRTITADTLRDAEAYAREALAWLRDDGLVTRVDVTVRREGVGGVVMPIVLTLPDDRRLELAGIRFDNLWQVIPDV